MSEEIIHQEPNNPRIKWRSGVRNVAYIFFALIIFLFALDLMISSFEQLGKSAAEAILLATSNPFTALFIGLLITAIIQSSSATTSMVVALVASGSLTLESSLPIIMGANIGTTITSTIVSLGFISKRKEFIRAVSAGTYHDFFNILTVAILFPIEYYYGFLSSLSQQIAMSLFHQPVEYVTNSISLFGSGFNPLIRFLMEHIGSSFLLVLISFGLLFGSILFFRKVLTDFLGLDSKHNFQKYFLKSPIKAFGWGLVATAAIRSSTITTSLVVPFVAKKLVSLKNAAPFILGANIGTTITAFIASAFNSNSAINIAIAHFLFNFFGVLVFLFIPYIKDIPLNLARNLGKLTRKYRLAGFVYILLVFFFVPFSLIYLHKDQTTTIELSYNKIHYINNIESAYFMTVQGKGNGSEYTWAIYDNVNNKLKPGRIIPVYRRNNILFINEELFEFHSPGLCRNNKMGKRSYELCVERILPHFEINSLQFDSVYVFRKFPVQYQEYDSITTKVYISRPKNLLLKKEKYTKEGHLLLSEELATMEVR